MGCKSLYITHGLTAVNSWDYLKAMEVLVKYGFLDTNTPILISVEKHFDDPEHLSYFLKGVDILTKAGINVVKHSDISPKD